MKFEGSNMNPSRLGTWLMRGASTTALLAISMAPALAQQVAAGAPAAETVVVTGTLIKGINPVGTNLVSVSAAQITANGSNTVDRILEEMPQVGNLFNTVPTPGTTDVGNTSGVHPAIHRGAGSTLQLVNGHNIVGVGALQTTADASEVPAIVTQRVDVVADGGSALYGADAVAGTINLITRRTYDGFMATASYGSTGNYDRQTVGVMAGTSWEGGNVYLAYEYTHNGYQMSTARPYPRQYLPTLVGPGALDNRAVGCPLANITATNGGVTTAYAMTTNALPNTPGAIKSAVVVGTNKCDINGLNGPGSVGNNFGVSVVPTEQQHGFWGAFSQSIGEGIDFTMTASYSTHTAQSLAAMPLSGNLTITNANPYFQPIGTETKQGISFNFMPAFGPWDVSPETEEIFEVNPDLNVEIGSWQNFKDWSVDLKGNYGRSRVTTQTFGLQNAINLPAVNGFLASTDPKVALDPYNLNLTSGQTLATIQDFGQWAKGVQQLGQVEALAQGVVWSLPGGDVHLAVGTRYSYESVDNQLYNGPTGGQLNITPALPIGAFNNFGVGHRITESVYGETIIPIFGDGNELPFVHALSFDISGRYDHLAQSGGGFKGGTNNYRLSVNYSPIAGLNIRGNMGTSFVAPGLDDAGAGPDTRVNFQPSAGPNPFESAAQQAIDRTQAAFQIAGGNINLKPQKGVTSSYGFDYTPDFIDGLTLGLTRWKVNVHQSLQLPGIAAATVQFDANGVTPSYAPYIILHPTLAQLIAITTQNGVPLTQNGFQGYAQFYPDANGLTPYKVVDARRYNFGTTQASGWDFNVNYVMQTDFGSLSAGVNGTDYTRQTTVLPTSSSDNLAFNTAPYVMAISAGATYHAFTTRLVMQYSAGYSASGLNTATYTQNYVGAFMPVNLFMSYDLNDVFSWTKGATINLNMDNIADALPPIANTGGGTANGATLGRFTQVTLTKKF